jgi:hypothetical protein
MKKNILIAVLAVIATVGYGYTANLVKNVSTVLLSERGNEVLHPGAIGKSYKHLASATGVVVCTGKCLLFDVILDSGATSSYATIEDTYTAEAGTNSVFVAAFGGAGVTKALSVGSMAFPVTFDYGITLDLSSVAAGEHATVIYKDLD